MYLIADTKKHQKGSIIMSKKEAKSKTKINKIEITNDKLTGRAGLTLFNRYLTKLKISNIFVQYFGNIRKSKKGASVSNIFHQIMCYFIDGTSLTLSYFDTLSKNDGYAATIEMTKDNMCSSHTIKRFFQKFSGAKIWLFRLILLEIFLWRLIIEKPKIIKLGIDTMVLDNDEALKKQGVNPTYKKKKGFQPLQMTWGNYLIDAIFRSGEKHSNYSNHVSKMVKTVVKKIRKRYKSDVPIILKADTGFFDEKNFEAFEKLEISYIVGGKLYKDIKEYVQIHETDNFSSYEKGNQTWDYVEFGNRRKCWKDFRRAVFTTPRKEGEQLLLNFGGADSVIYTNIGKNERLTEKLTEIYGDKCLSASWIIEEYHARGADELVHKGLKDLGTEQMPFHKFNANAAFYYMMVIAFNLFESYKYDVTNDIVPTKSLAKTLRRVLIDFGGKIVSHGGQVSLKVSESIYHSINIQVLWEKCNNPPIFL